MRDNPAVAYGRSNDIIAPSFLRMRGPGWCPWIACIKEQRSDAEYSLVELGVKVAWHAMAQQGFHDPRLVRHACRHSWAVQPLIWIRLRASNYLRPRRTSREAISA